MYTWDIRRFCSVLLLHPCTINTSAGVPHCSFLAYPLYGTLYTWSLRPLTVSRAEGVDDGDDDDTVCPPGSPTAITATALLLLPLVLLLSRDERTAIQNGRHRSHTHTYTHKIHVVCWLRFPSAVIYSTAVMFVPLSVISVTTLYVPLSGTYLLLCYTRTAAVAVRVADNLNKIIINTCGGVAEQLPTFAPLFCAESRTKSRSARVVQCFDVQCMHVVGGAGYDTSEVPSLSLLRRVGRPSLQLDCCWCTLLIAELLLLCPGDAHRFVVCDCCTYAYVSAVLELHC